MKFRGKAFLSISLLVFPSVLFAQSSFYCSFGYGLSGEREPIHIQVPEKAIYGSFGKGFRASLGFGFFILKDVEIVIDHTRVWGAKFTLDKSTQDRTEIIETFSRYWQFSPGVKGYWRFRHDHSTRWFVKVAPVFGNSTLRNTLHDRQVSYRVDIEVLYKSKISLGAQFLVGTEVPIRDNMYFFASFGYTQFDSSPSQSDIETFKIGGVEQIGSLTLRDRRTVFVKETGEPKGRNYPSEELKFRYALSSISLDFGLRLRL